MKRNELKRIRTISDKVLMSLRPEAKDYRVCIEDKIYFFVKSNGNKSWQVRYKNSENKWSWKGLGAFPEVNLHQVRTLADDCLSAYAKNHTCGSSKARSEKFTLMNLMESWLKTKKEKWTDETYKKAEKSIRKHIYSTFGQRNFKEIGSDEWYEFFEKLDKELKIPTQMRKLFSYVRDTYDWASICFQYNENPVINIGRFLGKHKNDNFKYIAISEIKNLLADIRSYPIESIRIGLELLLLQFPRHGELRNAEWEEIDFENKVWVKPAWKTKNNKVHRACLSQQSIDLLKRLKEIQKLSKYLFPSRSDLNKPMSEGPFTHALKKMGYKGKMTVHGFRYIASTVLNETFSSKAQVIEATLAHKKLGVKGIYDKAEHGEESAELMQWWADYVNIPNTKTKIKTSLMQAYGSYKIPIFNQTLNVSISC